MIRFWKRVIRWSATAVVLGGVALLIADCDDSDSKPAAAHPVVAPGNGVIRGVVKFSGPVPPVRIVSGDNECCPGAAPVPDETTVVNLDGTLKNVVIYIENGPNLSGDAPPIVLDQKDCRYVPHVVAVRTNQSVDVSNHDATMHNVYLACTANPAQNFSESHVGESHRISFAMPEMINAKCAVHPWMSAWICVFDHPCFAVTGDDGKFEIPHLPAGTYNLVAWHEKYGKLSRTVAVTDGSAGDVTFTYQDGAGH